MYLGAWGLTAVHIISGWMVIAIHQRFEVHHGGRARHAVTVWWRGPWDPVGRLIWLPVRLADAWQVLRQDRKASRTQEKRQQASRKVKQQGQATLN